MCNTSITIIININFIEVLKALRTILNTIASIYSRVVVNVAYRAFIHTHIYAVLIVIYKSIEFHLQLYINTIDR